MKEDIAKRWVEALRSSKYKQGKDQLQTSDNKFCCLGVLCDIVKDDVGGTWDGQTFRLDTTSETINLPEAVKQFTLMKSYTGSRKGKSSLIKLNDNRFNQYNFNRIADIIEKEWKDL